MRFKIFISSVQSEFADERRRLAAYIRQDALLGRFFDVFIFEETPACDDSASQVYLNEVRACDIYLCLIGCRFGNQIFPGLSATECEYDLATELSKSRLAFVLDTNARETEEQRLLSKIEASVVRRSFSIYSELQTAVYASLVRFLEQRGYVRSSPFDLSFDTGLTANDIDPAKIAGYLSLARTARKVSVPEDADTTWILDKLDAISHDGRITNAAALLFGKDPQQKFISSAVKCLHYWGTHVERPIPSYKIFEGGLIDLIENALDFVMSRIDRTIGTPDAHGIAAAVDELPRLAVREAIVNAVCHRDYESSGSVQVMLFRDRLEIINAGALPAGWSAEDLVRTHDSRPRNETIAKALDWAGFVERSGHGTEFIVEQCTAIGLRPPEYHIRPDAFHVIIWRKTFKDLVHVNDVLVREDQDAVPRRTKTQPCEDSTNEKLRILRFCTVDRAASEIQSLIGLANHTRFKRQWLNPLISDGIIECTLPDKPTSRYQKYRITDKGRAILNHHEQ